ncbi:MAG TPA: DsrE family protein [Candidatus Lustribacter sp.]|nr:DsrE family protein [Candidatus Lustribacter sp.]
MDESPAGTAGPRPGLRPLVVKVTCGVEAVERLSQAFTVAATAALAGAPVSVWLTGEAVWLAVPGRAEDVELAHSTPLAALRDDLLDAARITACTQCAARRGLAAQDLLPGIQIRGSASFVEEVLGAQAQALVY